MDDWNWNTHDDQDSSSRSGSSIEDGGDGSALDFMSSTQGNVPGRSKDFQIANERASNLAISDNPPTSGLTPISISSFRGNLASRDKVLQLEGTPLKSQKYGTPIPGQGNPEINFSAPHKVGENRNKEREATRKQQTALRKGLFSVSELEDWSGEEYPDLDKQIVIRFPEDVAELLRMRLCRIANESLHGNPNTELGLSIIPKEDFNYRIFDIRVTGYDKKLAGVLVELPTIIETYKCIDGDLLFKSGDVSQMIYIYDPDAKHLDITGLCEKQQWEWKGGITAPTHNIRPRKYKNLDLFDRQEIRDAELEVLELLHSLRRDAFQLEVHSQHDMMGQREKYGDPRLCSGPTDRIITADEDVLVYLSNCDFDEKCDSDASDVLFGFQNVESGTTQYLSSNIVKNRHSKQGPGFVTQSSKSHIDISREGDMVAPDSPKSQLSSLRLMGNIKGSNGSAVGEMQTGSPMHSSAIFSLDQQQNDEDDERREKRRVKKEKRKSKKEKKKKKDKYSVDAFDLSGGI